MAKGTVIQKILANHLVSGSGVPGDPAAIRIDQTLTQDATGTMAYLELEAMGTGKVKTAHSIDPEKCIKCGACKAACKFGAVKGI